MLYVATLFIEFLATIGLLLVVWRMKTLRTRRGRFRRLRAVTRRWRGPWAVALVAGVALSISVGISAVKFPLPSVHDEFSYLLAADTFANGRVTNPSHPMWMHFETFHVIVQPTYASKYPPVTGLLLALGQCLGHPIIGVWISTTLAAGATCWMLQGWMPGRWALLGGLLTACHPMILVHWGQNYWGGQAAMIGGALVFGALPRIFRQRRAVDSLLMALGAVILANSRPFEGFVTCLPPAAAILFWFVGRRRPPASEALLRVCLPVALVFASAVSAMGYYHWRVTGEARRMPYQVHQDTYHVTPVFLWQDLNLEPQYRHRVLRDFYLGYASVWYDMQRTWTGVATIKGKTLAAFWLLFLRVTLTVPLVMLPWVLRRRWMWIPLTAIVLVVAASMCGQWLQPHYFASIFPAGLLLVVSGLRHLKARGMARRSVNQALVSGLIVIFLLASTSRVLIYFADPHKEFAIDRDRVVRQLQSMPGEHLVLVRYAAGHNPLWEWVYNAADIDAAKIVWAREMSPEQNRHLLKYFADRRVWLLEADEKPPRLHENLGANGAGGTP